MKNIFRRAILKLTRLSTSLWFRVKYRVFAGTIRIDAASIARISWGQNLILRGMVAVEDSTLDVGKGCSIATEAEVGVAGKGVVMLHDGVSVGPRTIISTTNGRIEIGENTSFFSDCIISGEVSIGPGCLFANNVTVLTSTHEIHGGGTIRENDAAARRRPGYKPYSAVAVGADCWFGANSVLLPGVTLGRGCVVGANAVVTKSFPEYSILVGVPAKMIDSRRGSKE